MRTRIVAGIATAVVLAPSSAMAQLQFDPTVQPTRETGGWVYNAAQLMAFLGIVTVILVWAGYMRWSPKWAAKREKKAAPPPAEPALAPAIPKPERPTQAELAEEAAAASAESVGEAPPAAVAVVEAPPAGAEDVYQKTLDELLAKGVPQKVAEARAKAAAKKAGG